MSSSENIKARVLYIEDNPANIKLMQDIFAEFLPYDLLCAMNARDGIEIAQKEQPGMILMDINMAEMNGFEALAVLQQSPAFSTTPVIAVSGDAMPEQIEKALAAGFSDYVSKPFNVMELIDTIKQKLN